ncbi:MAG: hypothetical protein ACP5HJ_01755 [Candidatus Micrarchaeia archaeon]
MTVYDIFYAVVVISAIVGFLSLTLSYIAIKGMTLLHQGIANIPTYTPSSLSSMLGGTASFLPTISMLLVIVLIIFSWMLSAFIKANPIGAIISVAWLFLYTIASFFVSNALIQAAQNIPIFTELGSTANFVFLFWANAPTILVFASIIDIVIAVLAYKVL